ncbi:TetR/AcrR family transcriptional regulator [Curtobacterium sp. MCPF17_031]|nr:TetR/AcrR family transcriptional regulator [Curtobacterium sp. MCPF17_031]
MGLGPRLTHHRLDVDPGPRSRCSKLRPVETRPYRSRRRASSAAETRRIILDAALAAYREHGYARATIAGIAARADVAVNTVYTSVGGKPQLLVALVRSAAAEAFARVDEDVPTAVGSTAEEVLGRISRVVGSLYSEHTWLLDQLWGHAPADPAIAGALQEVEAIHSGHMAQVARQLEVLGRLRPGLGVDEATDVLWFSFGFRQWKTLCERGWDADRARSWLDEQIAATVLAPVPASEGSPASDSSAHRRSHRTSSAGPVQ